MRQLLLFMSCDILEFAWNSGIFTEISKLHFGFCKFHPSTYSQLFWFSFIWLKNLPLPRGAVKNKKSSGLYRLQDGDDTFTQKHNARNKHNTEQQQLHRHTLRLTPWFLFNFKPQLSSRRVKGVSAQHRESGCSRQLPAEEGHWIQSQELLRALWHEHASAPSGTQTAFCSWSITPVTGLQGALHKSLEINYVYKAEEWNEAGWKQD